MKLSTNTITPTSHGSVLPNVQERLQIWEKAKGIWKNKKPDPIKELAKIRKEWKRKLP